MESLAAAEELSPLKGYVKSSPQKFFLTKKESRLFSLNLSSSESSSVEVFESTGDLKYNPANFLVHGSKVGAILENH